MAHGGHGGGHGGGNMHAGGHGGGIELLMEVLFARTRIGHLILLLIIVCLFK